MINYLNDYLQNDFKETFDYLDKKEKKGNFFTGDNSADRFEIFNYIDEGNGSELNNSLNEDNFLDKEFLNLLNSPIFPKKIKSRSNSLFSRTKKQIKTTNFYGKRKSGIASISQNEKKKNTHNFKKLPEAPIFQNEFIDQNHSSSEIGKNFRSELFLNSNNYIPRTNFTKSNENDLYDSPTNEKNYKQIHERSQDSINEQSSFNYYSGNGKKSSDMKLKSFKDDQGSKKNLSEIPLFYIPKSEHFESRKDVKHTENPENDMIKNGKPNTIENSNLKSNDNGHFKNTIGNNFYNINLFNLNGNYFNTNQNPPVIEIKINENNPNLGIDPHVNLNDHLNYRGNDNRRLTNPLLGNGMNSNLGNFNQNYNIGNNYNQANLNYNFQQARNNNFLNYNQPYVNKNVNNFQGNPISQNGYFHNHNRINSYIGNQIVGNNPFMNNPQTNFQRQGINHNTYQFNNQNNKANNEIKQSLNLPIDFASLNEEDLSDHAFDLAQQQSGCRLLQKRIEENPNFVNRSLFRKLRNKFYLLINDQFGNYFLQKLIENLNENLLDEFIDNISNDSLNICINSHGTRVIQKLVECLKSKSNIEKFIEMIKPYTINLMKDFNGNHIIQRFISRHSIHSMFIFDSIKNRVIEICIDKHSCCAIQKLLEFCPDKGIYNKIISIIIKNTNLLIADQYGNYVIQFILAQGNYEVNRKIVNEFILDIENLSKQKYSSNVIEKVFDYSDNFTISLIVSKLANEELIKILILDFFGNYVIQKSLSVALEPYYSVFVNSIIPVIDPLKKLPFGPKLIQKLISNYQEIKDLYMDYKIKNGKKKNTNRKKTKIHNVLEKPN